PGETEFDDFLLHVDGWLCEVKDAQICDGLHTLGLAPAGDVRGNLVLTMLRAAQMWSGTTDAVPGLRSALGLTDDAPLAEVDAIEQTARHLVQAMEDAGWDTAAADRIVADRLGHEDPEVGGILRFAAEEIVPRLDATADELDQILHALDGGFIRPGPSGSPLRGLVNVLPTGRNFYTVDPKAVPSRLAYETGAQMAGSLLDRYLAEEGDYPRSVGLSVWGTSA